MDEDQEAPYQSPSDDHNYNHNHSSPLEDPGSLATGDTNRNSKTNQESADGSGLCIKIKGGAASNNNEHPRVCHICNKGFSSGKALGGHMRVHALSSSKQIQAKEGTDMGTRHVTKPNNNNTWVLVGRPPTCYLCRKSFPSMKSLFGHMRSHPEREWRGIQPPSTTNRGASSNPTSSSTLSDDQNDFAVDLSRALGGWSVTAKRGRKSIACNTDSGFQHGIEQQCMQEAVYQLMLLAHGNPAPVLECEGTSKRNKHASYEVELSVSPTKKLKTEEKSLNKMGYEEEELESDSQKSDGSTVGTVMKNKNKNSNQKKKKGTRKMQLTELETAEEGNNLITGTANRYRCSICNKCFPSHQALGGHRSSHNKSRNIQIIDESESEDDVLTSDEEEEERNNPKTTMQGDETETVVQDAFGCSTLEVSGHQCNICNKNFPTGQALGGHKRSHWTGIAEGQSAQATSPGENGQNCPKILNFDLNQPPAMDGEEGVQSDLCIPTNVASSGYASSSQNLLISELKSQSFMIIGT